MGIVVDPASLVKPEEKKGFPLGEIIKVNNVHVMALGWDNVPDDAKLSNGTTTQGVIKVDGDIFLVGVDGNNEAVDIVHFDPKDKTKVVTSGTGAYVYLGDSQDGDDVVGGDDEWALIKLAVAYQAGIRKTLAVASLSNLTPPEVTWADVPNAYMRNFPEGVSSREGKLLQPDHKDTIKSLNLTKVGKGARVIVYGWYEHKSPTDVTFVTEIDGILPAQAPDIPTALAPYGFS